MHNALATQVAQARNHQKTHRAPFAMLATPRDFTLIQDADAAGVVGAEMRLWFRNAELLVDDSGTRAMELNPDGAAGNPIAVGHWQDKKVTAQGVARECPAPVGTRWAGLRSLFGVMADDLVAIAGRAAQLVDWDRSHQFCGVCATPTVRERLERARRCPACGHSAYPRISPAMMCLVTRGPEILLARNVNFPAGRFSALAGFLEAGESIEDAITREVREEVGIEVRNPIYFGSQSWPFPHSLMIAFTAEYAGGRLTPNGHEIAEAGWFNGSNLPQLPPRISIARALIDDTLQRLRND